MLKKNLGIFALLIALGFSSACSTQAKEAAIQDIKDGNYEEAETELLDLIDRFPDDQELRAAVALAALGQVKDQMEIVPELLVQFWDTFQLAVDIDPADFSPSAEISRTARNQVFARVLRTLFTDLKAPTEQLLTYLEDIEDGTTLEMSDFYFSVLGVDVLDLSGTWDYGDFLFLRVLLSPGVVLSDLALAVEWQTDFLYALETYEEGIETTADTMAIAVEMLSSTEYPNFLGWSTNDYDENGTADGEQYTDAMIETFLAAMQAYAEALEWKRTNTDQGIIQVSENFFGEERIVLQERLRVDSGNTIESNIKLRTEDTEFRDILIYLTEEEDEILEAFIGNLSGDGDLISLTGDFLNLISPIILTMFAHLDIPSSSGYSSIDGYADISYTSPIALANTADSALPSELFIDIYSWLTTGNGIRSFLPAYRTDLEAGQNNFLMEWECPGFYATSASAPVGSTDSIMEEITCPEEGDEGFEDLDESTFELVDGDHFDDDLAGLSLDVLEADGEASPLPIIYFADPSFGGMLYFDASSVVSEEPLVESGVALSTNRTINAWLGKAINDL